MKLEEFNYDLPDNLIAQKPSEKRSESRLLKLDKKNGDIEHKIFKDITKYFKKGDCIVFNNTKVLPARIYGERTTGAKVEFLLLKNIEGDKWETLVKPGKKAREGDIIVFANGKLKAKVKKVKQDGNRIVEFEYKGVFREILSEIGEMPLPPYITRKLKNQDRYQTVYAKHEGSAAAPTAGLHFTDELIRKLKEKGVKVAYVTLHVGLGTFRPVKTENIEEHNMHSEWYNVTEKNAEIINKAKDNGNRVIAVGTTATRTLESCSDDNGVVIPGSDDTDIFIYPGYSFKVIDGLITNFHLPKSTLIMLVSALSNREIILNAYKEAVKNKYRFFSFGDAMLII